MQLHTHSVSLPQQCYGWSTQDGVSRWVLPALALDKQLVLMLLTTLWEGPLLTPTHTALLSPSSFLSKSQTRGESVPPSLCLAQAFSLASPLHSNLEFVDKWHQQGESLGMRKALHSIRISVENATQSQLYQTVLRADCSKAILVHCPEFIL